MLTINSLNLGGNVAVVFSPGEKLFVRYIGSPEGGTIGFKEKTIVVVEELQDTRKGLACKHLRFTRPVREERALSELSNEVKPYPKLRAALNHAQVPKLEVPGGFNRALRYSDELLVPDYSMSGSSGWLIKSSEVGKYLRMLPPLKDSGEIGQVWVNFVGYVNTPDECSIQICAQDPTGQPAPQYYDRPRGCYMSNNHQIFLVEFDLGSGRVKRILNQTTGQEGGTVWWTVRPVGRSLSAGQRVPGTFLGCYKMAHAK